MAKGAESKNIIINKILDTFDNSFLYDGKEIRIPMIENGEQIQIKCTLTCAKTNVEAGGDVSIPSRNVSPSGEESAFDNQPVSIPAGLTEQEKKDVTNLIETLGL